MKKKKLITCAVSKNKMTNEQNDKWTKCRTEKMSNGQSIERKESN